MTARKKVVVQMRTDRRDLVEVMPTNARLTWSRVRLPRRMDIVVPWWAVLIVALSFIAAVLR